MVISVERPIVFDIDGESSGIPLAPADATRVPAASRPKTDSDAVVVVGYGDTRYVVLEMKAQPVIPTYTFNIGSLTSERGLVRHFVAETEKRVNEIASTYLAYSSFVPLDQEDGECAFVPPDVSGLTFSPGYCQAVESPVFMGATHGADVLDLSAWSGPSVQGAGGSAAVQSDSCQRAYCWTERWHTLRRALACKLRALRSRLLRLDWCLRLLDRLIRVLIDHVLDPTFHYSLVFLQRDWYLHHGAHPPRIIARGAAGLLSAGFGGLSRRQVCSPL